VKVRLLTGGVVVEVESGSDHWTGLVRESCGGRELQPGEGPAQADVRVTVGRDAVVEPTARHRRLTRGAWSDGREVVLADACSSGLDLAVRTTGRGLDVVARPRPGWRHRALGLAAPDRRLLLHRAVLVQYPALWWAGVLGRAPLHVSAVHVDGMSIVLAGPGGVGKSTLVATLDGASDAPVSDNLCVTDGHVVHGLLEPARVEGGAGRRMPHGRRETSWPRRLESVAPDAVVVLRRGDGPDPVVRPLDREVVARELIGGTYAAGELRRYWAFAATLALGTGLGPAHPPVADVSRALAGALPGLEVLLPSPAGVTLRDLAAALRTGVAVGTRTEAQS
jgi:hypothetical protein